MLRPEDVYDLIPRTYPKANPAALAGFEVFPGLGKFDLRQWEEDNGPMLSTEGWLKLVMLIASSNFADLEEVFDAADVQLKLSGIAHRPIGKKDAAGQLLMAKRC